MVPVIPQNEAISAALNRVVSSETFAQSARMCRFLRFIVDASLHGDQDALKESVLAVAVFDRRPDYDPKLDSIVRVEARRLRAKLLEYYSGEGAGDAIRFELPKGAYRVEIVAAAPVASPPPPLVPAPLVAKNRIAPRVAGAVVCVIALAAATWYFVDTGRTTPPVYRFFTTFDGTELRPAFSPDGQSIAYYWSQAPGPSGIYVQRIDSDNPTLVSGGKWLETVPAWSPDGSRIAFLREAGNGRTEILSVASIGGGERKLGEVSSDTQSALMLNWSPDGKTLLTSERSERPGPRRLALLDIATGKLSPITNPAANPFGDSQGSFSPDGRYIVFTRTETESVEDLYILDLQDLAAGPRRLTHAQRGIVGSSWSADGRSIIFVAKLIGSRANLFRIPVFGSGEPILIPEAGDNGAWPSVARRGDRLVLCRGVNDVNLQTYRPGSGEPATPILVSTLIDTSPQVSPDGRKIAFRSTRTGSHELWVANIDGSNAARVTNIGGPLAGSPRWSPDGKYVVYDSRQSGNSDIYIISAAGGPSRRFTNAGSNEAVPSWSADGRFLYYASDRTARWEVWKQPVDGGAAVQVTTTGGFTAFESSDGTHVYYSGGPVRGGLWRMPVTGGAEEPVLPKLNKRMWGNWAIGQRVLYYIDYDDPDNVRSAWLHSMDLKTGSDTKLWKLASPPAAWDNGMGLAPDGKTLLFSQVDRYGTDLGLLENFR